MTNDLTGQVAVITGAGQGIGVGIAHVFARAGATIVVATRTAKSGLDTVDSIVEAGGTAHLIQADLGKRSEAEKTVAETIAKYGRLDIMIHNAGVYPMHPIEDLTDDILDMTLSVNLKCAFWLTQACLPHFRKQGRGRLVFTSSVTGPTAVMPCTAHYAASKAGLNGFIRSAAVEFARENITVNGVEPGFIMTPAMNALEAGTELDKMADYIPMGKFGTPEDIGHAMLFLASDEAGYISGQTIVVDGGSTLPESPVLTENFYADKRV